MPATLERADVQVESTSAPREPSPAATRAHRFLLPWPEQSVPTRLRVLRRARRLLAANADALAQAIPAFLPRTHADSLVAEVLPLLAAIKFLEKEAAAILAPRVLGKAGLPFWLSGLHTTIKRVPLGTILILAPGNYPLLLAGVQTMQALAAGNSVVWKPGRGGRPVAELFARLLAEAGLPEGFLRVTEDTVEAAQAELAAGPAKILFTGGADAGRLILHHAAATLTPVIAELSGCDAMLVLPTADPKVVADALLFGLRLNGSQTCMAPRRLILVDTPPPSLLLTRKPTPTASPFMAMSGDTDLHPTHTTVLETLKQTLPHCPPTTIPPNLQALLKDATDKGATLHGDPTSGHPLLLLDVTPDMAITHADVFFPILSVLRAASPEQAVALHNHSRLSLTAAIFGDHLTADWLAHHLTTGTVVIDDLLVPTADPRIPFGGRNDSGFGLTRGREGLLELTAVRTTTTRTNRNYRHFQATTPTHASLFLGLIEFTHTRTWRQRFAGLRKMIEAARNLKS